jgi:hypothetical protein
MRSFIMLKQLVNIVTIVLRVKCVLCCTDSSSSRSHNSPDRTSRFSRFSVDHDLCCCRLCEAKKLESTERSEFVRCFLSDPVVAALNNGRAWFDVVTPVLIKVQFFWDVITCRSEDWLIDLHWVQAITVPMHLGLINGPFVSDNQISAQ